MKKRVLNSIISVIAHVSAVISNNLMSGFINFLSLPQKNKLFLVPVILLVIPITFIIIFIGGIFYAISVCFALWHGERVGVYATINEDGVLLESEDNPSKSKYYWHEIEKVIKIIYPIGCEFKLKLLSGESVAIDFFRDKNFESNLNDKGISVKYITDLEEDESL